MPASSKENTDRRDTGYVSWLKSIGRYPYELSEQVGDYSKWNRDLSYHCYMTDLDHIVCTGDKDIGGMFNYADPVTGKPAAIIEAKLIGNGWMKPYQYKAYMYLAQLLNVPFYVVEYDPNDSNLFWITPKDALGIARFGKERIPISRDMWKYYIENEVCSWKK